MKNDLPSPSLVYHIHTHKHPHHPYVGCLLGLSKEVEMRRRSEEGDRPNAAVREGPLPVMAEYPLGSLDADRFLS